jgi:glycerol-3-phosphate dehydrogenase (NAD(P)+)
MTTIAVLGAGAWGTAFAIHLARSAHARPAVTLWAREAAFAAELARSRVNARYLPETALPPQLAVTADRAVAARADVLVAATPVAALSELAREFAPLASGGRGAAPLFWLAKGFVAAPAASAGYALAHQVIGSLWPAAVGVASGPTFAQEVARGLPAALTVAATEAAAASSFAALVRGDVLRAYESDDLAGVEIGGATKNVLAIAAGASDGLGFGFNARAALITRGLAETARLCAALGGRRDTLMGLAGLGDLVLTCTGDLSRNRRVGLELAAGRTLPAVLADLGHVAEGVTAAHAVHALAAHHGVDMPICGAVRRVLVGELSPRMAVESLLRREPRSERH